MPTSRPIALKHICNCILNLQPKSVLDIGIGFGKNGFLAREYTDIWKGRVFSNWTTRIDGIEIFPDYLSEIQYMIYDNIYIGDAAKVIKRLGNYDMIICTAVLEHFTKEDGNSLLTDIKNLRTKLGIVVLPINVKPQGAVYGNEHERHVSEWTLEDLSVYGKVTGLADPVNPQFLLEI